MKNSGCPSILYFDVSSLMTTQLYPFQLKQDCWANAKNIISCKPNVTLGLPDFLLSFWMRPLIIAEGLPLRGIQGIMTSLHPNANSSLLHHRKVFWQQARIFLQPVRWTHFHSLYLRDSWDCTPWVRNYHKATSFYTKHFEPWSQLCCWAALFPPPTESAHKGYPQPRRAAKDKPAPISIAKRKNNGRAPNRQPKCNVFERRCLGKEACIESAREKFLT